MPINFMITEVLKGHDISDISTVKGTKGRVLRSFGKTATTVMTANKASETSEGIKLMQAVCKCIYLFVHLHHFPADVQSLVLTGDWEISVGGRQGGDEQVDVLIFPIVMAKIKQRGSLECLFSPQIRLKTMFGFSKTKHDNILASNEGSRSKRRRNLTGGTKNGFHFSAFWICRNISMRSINLQQHLCYCLFPQVLLHFSFSSVLYSPKQCWNWTEVSICM